MDNALLELLLQTRDQATLAAIFTFGYEYLKRSPWFTLVEPHMKRVHVIVSTLWAAASAAGLSYSWDAQAHTLLIAGLSLETLQQFVLQLSGQHALYKATKERRVAKAVVYDGIPEITATKIREALQAAERQLTSAVTAPRPAEPRAEF